MRAYSPHRTLKRIAIITGAVLVVAAVGYEGFRVLSKSSKTTPVKQVVIQSPEPVVETTAKDVPDAGTTKPYTNEALGLKLAYPDTWKVTDTTDFGVRLESPEFKVITLDQGAVAGNFRIYIRKGARASDSTYIGRGHAVAASETLTYTNPSPDQRKSTLLTQFGLDTPDNFGYFFIAGNFQLSKGDTLGPSYGKEAQTFIIAGGYSSDKLTDDMQTYKVATVVPATSNAYKQALGIIASLQLN